MLNRDAVTGEVTFVQVLVDNQGDVNGLEQVSAAVVSPDGNWVLSRGDPEEIKADMKRITDERKESQPIGSMTGGSTFKNPEGHSSWKLIDDAGLRGFTHGGAQVSDKHCNFLINTGNATSTEIEELGELVREKVYANSGIELEWEIRRVGRAQ